MDIRFISYDGKFPRLCYGSLTLLADGVQMTFGDFEQFPCFWESGGQIWFDEVLDAHIENGYWYINEYMLPENLKPFADEI